MLSTLRQFKSDVFQALAHPTRIGIIERLRTGELSVGALSDQLGVEQSIASHHLGILRSKYLVETRKEGNQIYYRLRDPSLNVVMDAMKSYCLAYLNDAVAMLQDERETAETA